MKLYIKEIEFFVKKWYFVTFILLVTVLGFGFDISNLTINIDSLAGDIYNSSTGQMITSGRFGLQFWNLFFKNPKHLAENSYLTGILGLFFLIWSAINFCILFKRASNNTLSMPAYTVFAACLVSYPLMNEIWEYYGANLAVCGGFLFISFSLLLIYDQLEKGKFNILSNLAVCFFMTIVCSGYESLICVFVFAVFAILFLKQKAEPNPKKYLIQGLIYLTAIIIGIILRLITHRVLLAVLNVEAASNGATQILWLNGNPISTVINLIKSILIEHILYSPLYFPLTVFIICIIIMLGILIYLLVKKKIFSALLLFGMLLSSELLSIIQGLASPYRTCQVFAILCAFTFMTVANRLKLKNIVPLALALVCIFQAAYLNYVFTLNHIRYQEEKAAIEQIGYTLKNNYPADKPVVFVGKFELCDNITEKVRVDEKSIGYKIAKKTNIMVTDITSKCENIINPSLEFPVTNVNSVINWSVNAFSTMLEELFAFHGFDINVQTDIYENNLALYDQFFKDSPMPCYPEKGYIQETDELIFVRLGESFY